MRGRVAEKLQKFFENSTRWEQVISTLTNLGTLSRATWTDRSQKLHDPTNTSSPTSDLDADIVNHYANPQYLLAADRQLLHRPISQVLCSRRATKKMDPQHTPRPSTPS
jgi:hypothetical protein